MASSSCVDWSEGCWSVWCVWPFYTVHFFWQEGMQLNAPLCNLCGSLVCGCYGLNVIIDSLRTPKLIFISYSKRFKLILI